MEGLILTSWTSKNVQDANTIADKVVVPVNSDEWLTRKKGKSFMPRRAKTRDYSKLRVCAFAISQQNGDDDSSSGAIRNFAIGQSDAKIVFCNGGDRSDAKKIREEDVCNMYNIDLKFGIGGNEKIASSSELVNDFLINPLNDLGQV